MGSAHSSSLSVRLVIYKGGRVCMCILWRWRCSSVTYGRGSSNHDKQCQYSVLYQPARRTEILPGGVKSVSFCSWTINHCMHLLVVHFRSCSPNRCLSLDHQGDSRLLHSIFPYSSHLSVGLLALCINEQRCVGTACQYQQFWILN